MLPAALVVAAEIEMAGVLPPDETIGAVPVTPVTVPLPVPAPMVALKAGASASSSKVKAKSVIGLAVMFPVLLREGKVLAVIERSAGAAAAAVLFTFIVLAAIFAILTLVTELPAIVAAKLPVPEPVTSPVRVMVWLPVFVPVMASNLILSAALMLPAVLEDAAEIEMTGAVPPDDTIGAVPVTPVTVPFPVPAPMVALKAGASASSSNV